MSRALRPVDFLLSIPRRKRSPCFSSRGVTVGMFSLPALPPAGPQSWFVHRELATAVWGEEKGVCLSAGGGTETQPFRTGVPESCVSGASWGQEVKEHMLSGDCSFGLKLSLGICKPLESQHVTQRCWGPTFSLSFLFNESYYESHACTCMCAHTCTHAPATMFYTFCIIQVPL